MIMSNLHRLPSTLDGLKRLAKRLKRERGIAHLAALDEAARAAGFENYRHAVHELAAAPPRTDPGTGTGTGTASHPVWVTAYWRDRDGTSGRETMRVEVSRPLDAMVTRHTLRTPRTLGHFRRDASDHIETREDVASQSEARERVRGAVRELQFMDVSGLVPRHGIWDRLRLTYSARPPGLDHPSEWATADGAMLVYADEPYSVGPDFVDARCQWARGQGLHVRVVDGDSMYAEGATLLLMTTLAQRPALDAIVDRLEASPRHPTWRDAWAGSSAPYVPVFVSPARARTPARKRERPAPVAPRARRGGAVVYGAFLNGQPRWRPDARMPLAQHAEAGRLIRSLRNRGLTKGSDESLSKLNFLLGEWLEREYSIDELVAADAERLYYGRGDDGALDAAPYPELLGRLKTILQAHYPDCTPRRDLLRTIDTAARRLDRRPPAAERAA
jgi:hypothetical protein